MTFKLNTTVEKFKEEFNNVFKGLSIEFYSEPHEKRMNSSNTIRLEQGVFIKEITERANLEPISFQANQKVQDIEEMFEKEYGLHVQILRRSGNIWLQTSSTDEWTMEKQNLKGLETLV